MQVVERFGAIRFHSRGKATRATPKADLMQLNCCDTRGFHIG